MDVKPITHLYPVGNPNDLVIIYFKFPVVKGSRGKEVDDMRSDILLDVVHEPIGHLLSKRRIALYLELHYSHINITTELVNRCYNVFKIVCQKATHIECIKKDSLDFSFESWYTNPSTFTESRTEVLKDLFSTSNPTFALCDIGYRINTHLEKNEKGEYIRSDCDLLKILLYEGTYLYFIKMWSTFPDLQRVYYTLRRIFPSDICNLILKHSTLGKKDHGDEEDIDPHAYIADMEKHDEYMAKALPNIKQGDGDF